MEKPPIDPRFLSLGVSPINNLDLANGESFSAFKSFTRHDSEWSVNNLLHAYSHESLDFSLDPGGDPWGKQDGYSHGAHLLENLLLDMPVPPIVLFLRQPSIDAPSAKEHYVVLQGGKTLKALVHFFNMQKFEYLSSTPQRPPFLRMRNLLEHNAPVQEYAWDDFALDEIRKEIRKKSIRCIQFIQNFYQRQTAIETLERIRQCARW